jgi:hypothetical protein
MTDLCFGETRLEYSNLIASTNEADRTAAATSERARDDENSACRFVAKRAATGIRSLEHVRHAPTPCGLRTRPHTTRL